MNTRTIQQQIEIQYPIKLFTFETKKFLNNLTPKPVSNITVKFDRPHAYIFATCEDVWLQ